MRSSLLRLALPLATSIAPLVAACGGGIGDADFTRATTAQRTFAVQLADDRGIDGLANNTYRIGWDSEGICPAVTEVGDEMRLVGGCTQDRVRYEGSAIVVGGEDDLMEVTWNDFAAIEPTLSLRIDGHARADERGPNKTVAGELTVDFEHDGVQLEARIASHLARSADGTWTADANSSITIEGVGTADIGGAWRRRGGAGGGVFELRGANTLAVDFGSRLNGCYAATVDGAAVPPLCLDP